MLLRQISQSSRLTAAVMAIMMRHAPILAYLQWYSMVGNADAPRSASKAEGGKYRALNAPYPQNQVDPSFADVVLAILGDKVQTDIAHERRGADVPSVRAQDLRRFAEWLAKFFMLELVKGSGQGEATPALNGIEGLRPMGHSNSFYASGSNDATLDLAYGDSDAAHTARQKLKAVLYEVIAKVDGGPDALLVSNRMIQYISSVFEGMVEVERNEFGVLITMFNRIPLLPAGYRNAGGDVIGQDETPGGITTASQSIYGLKFGTKADFTMATNTGLNVIDDGKQDSHYQYTVEMDAQAAALSERCISRASGIVLP